MRVYKFTKLEWALQSLKNQLLKTSRLEELNDPFELHGVRLENKATRRRFKAFRRRVSESTRLLCFSRSRTNPLMWAHYADNHKGVALELEVTGLDLKSVVYQKSRVKVGDEFDASLDTKSEEALKRRLLLVKYQDWVYEEELRALINKKSTVQIGNHDFLRCDEGVSISGLVIGPLCKLTDKVILDAIPVGTELRITRTRLAFKKFEIVKDMLRQPYTLGL